jgi:hypothetical protein
MSKDRRAVAIKFKDGTSKILELSKATAIRSDIGMLHLDKFKDETWRLTFSNDVAEDFSNIMSLEVIRDTV